MGPNLNCFQGQCAIYTKENLTSGITLSNGARLRKEAGVPEEGTAAGLEIMIGGAGGVREEEEVTQKSPLTTRSTPSEPAGTHSLTNAFTFFAWLFSISFTKRLSLLSGEWDQI